MKAKEAAKTAKKKVAEPKPSISRPIHTWNSLKFPTAEPSLEPKEEVSPRPRVTPNRFGWSPQHVDNSQAPAKSVELKVESSDIVNESPKSDSAKRSKQTGRSEKQAHDESRLVHIPDAASAAELEPKRVRPRKSFTISEAMLVSRVSPRSMAIPSPFM
jgi:hypothetical protein